MTSPARGAVLSLREITGETVREIAALKIKDSQAGTVSPIALSIAEAYFEPAAWFRVIIADETPIGFVMLYDPTLPGAKPHWDFSAEEITLWRFLIDGRYQGLGVGARALDLIVEHARTRPGMRRLSSSYVPIPEGPEGFYLKYGFKQTGRSFEDGTELEIAIDL